MKFFPIMGDGYKDVDYAPLDLGVNSSNFYCKNDQNSASLKDFVAQAKKRSQAKLLYGGYLEQRAIYTSDHFICTITKHIGTTKCVFC